jgi:hypothetical protein
VEFRAPQDIRWEYPNGIRELADGGTWNTIAGQPTDDSQLSCKGGTVPTVLPGSVVKTYGEFDFSLI